MDEEIREDNNCIVKAFENNPISIIQEEKDNKKIYCFKASDIGKALNIVNIRTSIQNFDGDEVVVRTTYDTIKRKQETLFLTSQGVYRLLYASKKDIAKKFRKWAGAILDDIIFNESQELKKQIEEKNKLIQEKEELLIEHMVEIQEKENIIKQLENKPDIEGFSRKPGYVYLVKDASKQGHYKIGFSDNPQKRMVQLNISSSTYSLELLYTFKTYDKEFAEKIIHNALHPFRIRSRREWFYFVNDIELGYAINTIKKCMIFIDNFNITDYDEFLQNINIQEMYNEIKNIEKQTIVKEINIDEEEKQENINIEENQEEENKENQEEVHIPEENKDKIEKKKTSKYTGVSYNSQRKYFDISIKYNQKTYNLGTSINEKEAAKIYNQQALYFNNEFKTNYQLNDIPDYITVAKNIFKEIQDNKKIKKSSKYYGVTYAENKSKYRSVLVHNKKQIHLGFYDIEIDAAKAYNLKANKLNENSKHKYKINIIQENDIL